jgi:hypothetical protein
MGATYYLVNFCVYLIKMKMRRHKSQRYLSR